MALAISAAVTRAGELSTMLNCCADQLARHLRLPLVRIWVCSAEWLELLASSGRLSATDGSAAHIRVGEHTVGRIGQTGVPFFTSNVAAEYDAAESRAAAWPITAFAGYPLTVEERVVGVLGLFSETTLRPRILAVVEPVATVIAQAIQRKRVESELVTALGLHATIEDRLAIIADASGALLESLELQPVLERVVGLAQKVLAADGYAVWRSDEAGTWRILLATGLSKQYQESMVAGPAGLGPLAESPVVAEDVDALPLVEHRRDLYHTEGLRSFIAFPLRIHGKHTATLTLYFRSRQQFAPEQVRIGSALANFAAAAIASAEAYEDQRRLREQAQESARRTAFVAEASKLLATTLDYEHTLRAVAGLAIPAFADWCAVDILGEDGEVRRLATVHADPERLALAESYHRKYPPTRNDPGGVNEVIRNNRPILAPEIPEEVLVQMVKDPERLRILRELQLRSVIIVPMAARNRVLGAITFVTAESGRRYDADDLIVAEQVAHRAALAIDNAMLFSAAEERHAEARRALQALGVSHQRLQQFAYAASHDLREPLRTITVYLQLIERSFEGRLDATSSEYLAFVTSASARIQELLDDLLRYVRLGDGASQRSPFSLADAAARAIQNLSITITESGAQISTGQLPAAMGDESQFVQLFQNLISNAIKYRGEATPAIQIRSERRDAVWAVAVQDNGVGIAPEHHEKIFGVFRRLHGQEMPGTGIGLAIARSVVENHGGRLWVESEGGQGATFWFTVPAQQAGT